MEDLGAALRASRLRRGLSLRAVAASADISPSLLSQVETGKTQPSVGTLYALVNVLEASVDELFGMPPRTRLDEGARNSDSLVTVHPVQRAADNPTIEMENGVKWERLAVEGLGRVDALLTTYGPGSSSSVEGKLMRHSGIEYGLILRGELVLKLDFDEYLLAPGDSMCFDSHRPHLYENRTGEDAQGIWFVLDRTRDTGVAAQAAQAMNSAVDVLGALGRMPVASNGSVNLTLP